MLTGTPQEAAEICKSLPKDAKWERALALALACRFRGLEHVRALTENGVVIGKNMCYLLFALLDINRAARMFVEDRMSRNKYLFADALDITDKSGAPKTLKILPAKKRTEIVRYLCENSKRVCIDPSKLLLYSIMSEDKKIAAELKEIGVTFSRKHISALTEDRRKDGWNEYYVIQFWLDDNELFDILKNIVREIGEKKLLFNAHILGYNSHHLNNRWYYSDTEKFGFILEHFNQKQMNKMEVMKCAILENSAACLKICTEYGWLTKPSNRDELIEFASEQNKTECLAFLLDYKNRNFDLEAERERAERIAKRKLNASPGSVTALRELFSWKKQDDGTIVITDYKGTSDKLYVPAKIGGSAVTAIGTRAFSRIPKSGKFLIENIKKPEFQTRKIVLPDCIKHIGEQAFAECGKLEIINIPDSVTHIEHHAFSWCVKLAEIFIPDSVRQAGAGAFLSCYSLQSVRLSESMDEIPAQMFVHCSSLRRVTLPNSIQRIGERAFANCESLEEIVIPVSVTEIGESIFLDAEKVTAVVEPDSCAEQYCRQNDIPFRYGGSDSL